VLPATSRNCSGSVMTRLLAKQSLIPDAIRVSCFSTVSRQALGFNKLPVQRVGPLEAPSPGLKRLGSEPGCSVNYQQCMDLYIYSSIRLHTIVLNQDTNNLTCKCHSVDWSRRDLRDGQRKNHVNKKAKTLRISVKYSGAGRTGNVSHVTWYNNNGEAV
jgi:hypothetical protein